MKPFHGSCRRNPSWAWHWGFLTAIAAVPLAAMRVSAEEKSPTASPQTTAEHRAAPAVSPAATAAAAGVANRKKPATMVVVYTVDQALAKIQVPEVATLRLEGGVALQSGQWLLLAGLKAENPLGQGEPASSSWKDRRTAS